MGMEFRRGGRRVSNQQFFDGMKKDIIKQAEDEIERRLRALRDPETGKFVKVIKSSAGGKTSWNVQGSAAAVEQAKKIMEGSARQ